MKGKRKKEAGFTLIEILIAVTIVGISFVVIMKGYMALTGLVQQMGEYQRVSSFASLKIDQVIQKVNDSTIGAEILGNLEINWQSIDQDVGDGVRRIMILIDWQSQKGPKEYKLTTLIGGGSYETRP
ncbi:MAG: type II secretion system protein [Halanaerobiales bacterium]|nr:type II secretion system protein [Halanaerobiales bacterium]